MLEILLSLSISSPLALAISQKPDLWPMEQQRKVKDLSHSAEAYYRQGVSFHQRGEVDEAIEAYQEAINLDPKFDAAYVNLGLLFISIGQFDQAEILLQKVLQFRDRPESPASIHALAYYNLAIIHSRQGQSATALEEVQKALAIAPDFSQAQQLLKQLQD